MLHESQIVLYLESLQITSIFLPDYNSQLINHCRQKSANENFYILYANCWHLISSVTRHLLAFDLLAHYVCWHMIYWHSISVIIDRDTQFRYLQALDICWYSISAGTRFIGTRCLLALDYYYYYFKLPKGTHLSNFVNVAYFKKNHNRYGVGNNVLKFQVSRMKKLSPWHAFKVRVPSA